MKKAKKLIIVISFILALTMLFETPIGALQSIADDSSEIIYDYIDESVNDVSSYIIGEIEDQRSEYTKTFRLENGNNLLVEYSVPIHYQNQNDNWVNYDNSLTENKKTIALKRETNTENISEFTPSEAIHINETESSSLLSSETHVEDNDNLIESTDDYESEVEITSEPTESEEQVVSTEEIPVYSTKNNNLNTSFSKTSSENNMVFIGESDNQVSWGYRDINVSKAKCVEDNTEYEGNEKYTVLKNLISTVKYESAYKNVDIDLFSTPLGVKENIILNNRDSLNTYISDYEIGDLTPKQLSDRVIALFNEEDKVVYYINAEYMYDANGKVSHDLYLRILDNSNSRLTVELRADTNWLNDPERAYPVVIDPTFITGQEWGSVQCTFIDSDTPNTAYGYGSSTGYTGTIYSGTYPGDGMNRSFIKVTSLPTLNKGDMIIDATVNLYLYNGYENSTGFYDDEYVGAYEVKENWNQSTLTWNTRPDFYAPLLDYIKFDETSEPDWYSMNITKSVKRWYQNPFQNYGIMLKSVDEANCEQCAEFFSSNYPDSATPRPAFQMTYRNNKGIEDYWTNTAVSAGNAGSLYVNDYSGALTFVAPVASTASPIMSTSLNYIYNTYMAKEKYNKSTPYTGKGWRMSVQQTLFSSSQYGLTGDSAEKYPYVYTDSDGTEHYFYKKEENNTTKYVDEDGLDLELTIGNNNNEKYTITDKDNNKLIFKSNGLLRYIKDAYNNTTTIEYSNNKITSITDASNNVIDFTINNNTNNYIIEINDPAGRNVRIDHTQVNGEGAFINEITRADGTSATFTYDNQGYLTSVADVDGYKVDIVYDNETKRVIEITESVESGNTATTGNTITFDRSKYNTTIMQSVLSRIMRKKDCRICE